MIKHDFKKEYKELYQGKPGDMKVVTVPKFNFLMVDGAGSPAGEEYANAIQTLYPVAYTLKFMCKDKLKKDYGVMPLEGLWWAEDMDKFLESKDNWLWTAMIMQPPFITKKMFEEAVATVKEKKRPPAIDSLKLEAYEEGRVAQVMYVGPYSGEGPTIAKLHDFLRDNGGELTEKNKHHHEIYLSDPRRTDESKLKTIIRQPF